MCSKQPQQLTLFGWFAPLTLGGGRVGVPAGTALYCHIQVCMVQVEYGTFYVEPAGSATAAAQHPHRTAPRRTGHQQRKPPTATRSSPRDPGSAKVLGFGLVRWPSHSTGFWLPSALEREWVQEQPTPSSEETSSALTNPPAARARIKDRGPAGHGIHNGRGLWEVPCPPSHVP